ncbi:MAG: tetratricopeptide repeat protein [Bacteroidota bacterium]
MKRAWTRHLPLILITLSLFACKSNNGNAGVDGSNPFAKDSTLRSITTKINEHPKDATLYFKRGMQLVKTGADSLALSDFKKAVALDSSKAEYFSAIGDLLFEHKDLAGSVQWLQKAMARNPNDPKAHLKVAKMMLFMQDYPKAFSEINTVLRQDVYNPEGYFLKGMIYKDLKDTDKAIASFQTAINTVPDYRDAIVQVGILYSGRRDPMALKYFDNAFKMDSSDVTPLYAKGMFYQEQKDYKNAILQYKECILHDHQFSNAFFNMGWIYLQEDSLDKAWRHFDIVTKTEPNSARAYYNRGLCSEMLKKKTEAISDYKQALVFEPKYPEAIDALKRLGAK